MLALGYAEPSYVLTLGTQNLHPPQTPLDLPSDPTPIRWSICSTSRTGSQRTDHRHTARLRAEADSLGACLTESPSYYALNYSNGDPAHFRAWRFDWGGCP